MTVKGQMISKLNSLLWHFGIAIVRRERQYEIPLFRHINIINEVEGFFSEFIFPKLVPCDGRAELIARLWGTGCSEAFYIIGYMRLTLDKEGDVCEFGVAQGATSALLANEIRDTQKELWLFDSFQGLPKPSDKDVLLDDFKGLGDIRKYQGTMRHSQDLVVDKLRSINFPLTRVKIIPGFIEDTIRDEKLPKKVCFAYLDFDFYEPTKQVLTYLDQHLADGGYVVVDDYGYFSAGIETAVNEFLKESTSEFRKILPHWWAGKFCILQKVKSKF